jgi:N-methylhydantoinase B
MPAASSGTLLVMAFGGVDPATGRPCGASELAAGGMGARPTKDGVHVVETDVSNCMNIPVEALEMNFPLRIGRTGLWEDSAGAGTFRGGLGLEKVFEATETDVTVAHRSERFRSAPWGLFGGGPARRGRAFIVRRDGTREPLPSKRMLLLHPGDQLWEYIPGGAGWGDPLERDPDRVLADVVDRLVSAETAAADYGVVLDAGGTAVDHDATKARREALARARGPVTWVFDRGGDQGREA